MLTFICASSAIVLAVLAYLNFKRTEQLRGILAQGAQKFEHQYEQLSMTRKRLEAAADVHSSLEQELRQLKQTQQVEGARNAKIVGELLNTQALMERKLGDVEAQRDQILSKYEALSDEREHLLSERSDSEQLVKTLEAECDRLQNELDRADKRNSSAHRDELNRMRLRLNQLETELKKRGEATAPDTADLESIRRKAAQNEQLFLSMKSLREMAEERNKNWEIALRKLSTWILTSSHIAQPKDPVLLQSSIGPLVGEALERIGCNLLDVDDSGDISSSNSDNNTYSAES